VKERENIVQGHYLIGCGKAHNCCSAHDEIFNHRMLGTFNILMEEKFIVDFKPSAKSEKAAYWFVELEKDGIYCYGWAVRDFLSHQRTNILEILTKELIPSSFKEGNINIRILERWNKRLIKKWAADQYWFQGFPFSPIKKADSKFLWDTIDIIDWAGCSVLDIGCHYGYFSFKSSKAGANVVGFDIDRKVLEVAEVIRDKIAHQGIPFVRADPGGNFDIILYLSVHHQPDPEYRLLKEKITELKSRADKHLFVELILPPMFPKNNAEMDEKGIDKIVGGEILATYKHRVRGMRRVYHVVTS